jgi:hypothetical protein
MAARLDLDVMELAGRRLDRRIQLVGPAVSREAHEPAPSKGAAGPGRADT